MIGVVENDEGLGIGLELGLALTLTLGCAPASPGSSMLLLRVDLLLSLLFEINKTTEVY